VGIAPLQPAKASIGAAAIASTLPAPTAIPPVLLEELWQASEAACWSITCEEFAAILMRIGNRHNYGVPQETQPTADQRTHFLRNLRLAELALAQGCAHGDEAAWQRFFMLYREHLTRAAITITRSETAGRDLADSLYSELYGLTTRDGQRRSPLASYSGRGSLLGWLNTTLAQRHVDDHRRTCRETPLEELDVAAPAAAESSHETTALRLAVADSLSKLPSDERLLLVSYYLDRRTLLEIGRLLGVHEATVSRKLKRLTGYLRKDILRRLQAAGLSRRAAEEALGIDPRDLDLNLRTLLQSSDVKPFSEKASL